MFLRPSSTHRLLHGTIKNARRWSYGAGIIKNARGWPYGAEKIKCCYQLRGHEKHNLFQEEEPLLLEEGSSTSARV